MATAVCSRISSTRKIKIFRFDNTAQMVEVHRQNLTAQPSVCRINCSLTGRRIKRFALPKIVRTIKSPVISELISQLDQYRPSLP